jgi:hypothetical protein
MLVFSAVVGKTAAASKEAAWFHHMSLQLSQRGGISLQLAPLTIA